MEVKKYTWFIEDWMNDPVIFNLTYEERGFYRELIDWAMLHNNEAPLDRYNLGRIGRTNARRINKLLAKLSQMKLIIIEERYGKEVLKVPSCEKRLSYHRRGSEGGRAKISKGSQSSSQAPSLNTKDLNKKEDTIKDSIQERAKSFGKKLVPFTEKYSKEMIREFFDYWTEAGENDKKMRFEKEKSFSIPRRLGRWKSNQKKFNKSSTSDRDVTKIVIG